MSAYEGDTAAIGKLIWNWGERYVISYANGLYHAERRDNGAQVHAPDPEQLGREIFERRFSDFRLDTQRSGRVWPD